MNYTVTFFDGKRLRFRFIAADSSIEAAETIIREYPNASIQRIRENNPALETIEAL